MRVPMTEYLEIDLDTERWLCRRCGYDLASGAAATRRGRWCTTATLARYTGRCSTRRGTSSRSRPTRRGAGSSNLLSELRHDDRGGISAARHPPTFDMEIDVDALKAYWARRSADAVSACAPDVPVNLGHAHQH